MPPNIPPSTQHAPDTLQEQLDQDADLVDRIFDYLLAEVPAFGQAVQANKLAGMKLAVRAEFAGDRQRIGPRTDAGRRDLVNQVLAMFNGRNAREVARRLKIGRATVYRIIKQANPPAEPNSLIPGRSETAPPVVSNPPTSTPPND